MSTASNTQSFGTRPGVNLYVESRLGTHADRPTLVFLHFWGDSTRTWSRLVPLLSPRYSTIALDFRGWGKSEGPSDPGAYSSFHLAEDVESVITELHLENVILVGLYMGAKVAQVIAGRDTCEAVKGLVLISSAPATPLTMPAEASEQQVHACETWQNAEFVARNVLVSSPSVLEDGLFKQVVENMLMGNEYARAAWPSYAMGKDCGHLARQIRAPVVVIAAAKDVIELLDRVLKEVCDIIPGSKLVVVPNPGHLSPLEPPDTVAKQILSFLEGF